MIDEIFRWLAKKIVFLVGYTRRKLTDIYQKIINSFEYSCYATGFLLLFLAAVVGVDKYDSFIGNILIFLVALCFVIGFLSLLLDIYKGLNRVFKFLVYLIGFTVVAISLGLANQYQIDENIPVLTEFFTTAYYILTAIHIFAITIIVISLLILITSIVMLVLRVVFIQFKKEVFNFSSVRFLGAVFFVSFALFFSPFQMSFSGFKNHLIPMLAEYSIYTFDMQDKNILCQKVSDELRVGQRIRLLNEHKALVATLTKLEIIFQVQDC